MTRAEELAEKVGKRGLFGNPGAFVEGVTGLPEGEWCVVLSEDEFSGVVADAEALAEALELLVELASGAIEGDHWFDQVNGIGASSILDRARDALARYRGEK